MSIFVCDVCGCVENTSLGHFWGRERVTFLDESKNGKALCSECTPSVYADGRVNKNGGKWHGKFPKVQWDGKREALNRKRCGVCQTLLSTPEALRGNTCIRCITNYQEHMRKKGIIIEF